MTIYHVVPPPPSPLVSIAEAATQLRIEVDELRAAIERGLLRVTGPAGDQVARTDIENYGRGVVQFVIHQRQAQRQEARRDAELSERLAGHDYVTLEQLAAEVSRIVREPISADALQPLIDDGTIKMVPDQCGELAADLLHLMAKLRPHLQSIVERQRTLNSERRADLRARANVAARLRADLEGAGASDAEIQAALARIESAADPEYAAAVEDARAGQRARDREVRARAMRK